MVTRRFALIVVALLAATCAAGSAQPANPRLLVFTKTEGFRHESIPAAIGAVRALAAKNGFVVTATEDDTVFSAAGLRPYDAVMFLLTTGDVLNASEQAAFETYIRAGHGYVGVHSAADTERDWPWYGRLVGAWSSGHPEIQSAVVQVVKPTDASTAGLPARWPRTDEWYGFLTNPRTNGVRVLLTLDESTYLPGEWAMGADHPIAWKHEFDGGRAWYTQGGHTPESYSEPLFLGHLLGGIQYALARPKAVAPKLRALSLTTNGGRVVVRALYDGRCTRCRATLRVHSRTTSLRLRWSQQGGTATGTSAVLPAGRWLVTVALVDPGTDATRTVSRWVRVSKI